ncbi:hypothetical protein GCM10007880_56390 [Mesorhizobium amorphae]|uniref:Uncharacterized protein n=1 Tax=Mesorhizobium amorphae CCNWGS0123 TaxID=1082933 RepID=G6YC48_9HYPH|nr:hypothetical protein A6B35_16030 [Mesorhizobium amorphae CCNWGS0123]EHH10722.1 hypothetical protein MEA186_17648 [Mesorhizobium amorphae CCNWGS0123]GLR45122.1 hypothetical protein GCM10007880_56390 [Mesorhizobium amorphae]
MSAEPVGTRNWHACAVKVLVLSRCSATPLSDSSLNVVLRFWIRDPQQGLTNVRRKVLLALWDSRQTA